MKLMGPLLQPDFDEKNTSPDPVALTDGFLTGRANRPLPTSTSRPRGWIVLLSAAPSLSFLSRGA